MSFAMQEEYPGGLSGCQLINLTTTELNFNALSSASMMKDRPSLSIPAFLNSFDTPPLPMTIRETGLDVYSNLSIFQHFVDNTSYTLTLSSHADSRHIWSQVIPTLSQAHPFLFHAILAVTCAHLGYIFTLSNQPEKAADVRRVEERHYVEAMRSLKMAVIEGIDEVNCHATFAAAVVCILYFVSRRRKPSPFNPLSGPIRRHLDLSWSSFIRGTCGALHGLWPMVMRGPVALLVYEFPSTESSTKVLSANTEMMLSKLNLLCLDFNILGAGQAGEMKVMANASGYYAALYNLRMVWAVLEDYCSFSSDLEGNFDSDGNQHLPEPQDRLFRGTLGIGGSSALCAAISQYVLRTPANFWDCLERKSPRALIIYAYYIVCWEGLAYGSAVDDLQVGAGGDQADEDADAHQRRFGRWWTQGRAETDLRGIEEELYECATDDNERRIWKEWIEGAWNVFEGLKHGWWIDNDVRASMTFGGPLLLG